MRFELDEDQRSIRQSASEMLASRCPLPRTRDLLEAGEHDAETWEAVRELGWLGAAIPERDGGAELGMVSLAVLAEQLGHSIAAIPFHGSVLAALVIDAAGSDEQRSRWLGALASGDAVGGFECEDGLVVNADADVFVRTGGGRASLLERERATVEPFSALDKTRSYARIDGDGEPLPGDVETGLSRCRVVLGAELVGLSRRALEVAVAYAAERQQFGRPIGAFQAVSHRCAEMYLEVEAASVLVYASAWAADAEPDSLPWYSSLASAKAGEAGIRVAESAIQVHGGIGFTWEADPHLFYRRAELTALLLGAPAHHYRRVARSRAG